ncbi:unnamed protein product, partial [Mesorhabditis spiculigera]
MGRTTIGEDPSKTPPLHPRSPDEHGNNKRKKLQPPIENLVPDETVSSTADEISSNSDRQKIIEPRKCDPKPQLRSGITAFFTYPNLQIQLEAERAARQPQEGPIVKDEPEDNPNAILKREIQELKQEGQGDLPGSYCLDTGSRDVLGERWGNHNRLDLHANPAPNAESNSEAELCCYSTELQHNCYLINN